MIASSGAVATHRVLFVCTGNICRSPTAHGVMLSLIAAAGLGETIAVDSCGLGGWHQGELADPRARQLAVGRGYDLEFHRARQIRRDDFYDFTLLLAMDRGHLRGMNRMKPDQSSGEIALFLDIVADMQGRDVPDPYYGSESDFRRVLDLVEKGCQGWLDRLRQSQ